MLRLTIVLLCFFYEFILYQWSGAITTNFLSLRMGRASNTSQSKSREIQTLLLPYIPREK